MRLKTVRIHNYKCIDDSEEFSLAPITCLVGKNESGKSAVLQALYKLKPVEHDQADFDDLEEYPRKGLTDYEVIKDEKPANVLTTVWELDQRDEKVLQDTFWVNPIRSKLVTVTKGYGNKLCWNTEVDEAKVVKYYLKQLRSEKGEITEGTKVLSVADIITQLENIKTPSAEQAEVLAKIKKNIPNGELSQVVNNALATRLPTFLYFADYQKMAGRVSFNALSQNISSKKLLFSEKIFLALLDLAGTTPKEIQELGKLEHLIAKLEGVSNKLTREIFEYWSQNEYLMVSFRFENALAKDPLPFNSGYVFMTRIENTRHQVSVSFEDRSTGFVWFFSFLAWFSQVRKTYGTNLFLLLDEPGLSLHAKAQGDLLRYINEKLKPHFQVIYSTHSPFMVDPDNIMGVRTVEDVVKNKQPLGTKIGDKVLSTDSDTLFPLQAALGYEITQTLFIGKHTLLVEGPSDLLYLKWFSQELKSQCKEGLDSKWVIAPAGGIDKIGSFITLFGCNKLHIAVFTDFHDGDKKKIRTLRDSEILKKGHVFSAEMFANQDEADIEDMFGRSTYITLVNECYSLKGSQQLSDKKPSKAPKRVVAEVEEHFRTLSIDISEFDHFGPASFLVENSGMIKKNLPHLEEALDRFDKLFKELNLLLKDAEE